MRSSLAILTVFVFLFNTAFIHHSFSDHKTLAIGADAPDFNLKSVDGKFYSLSSFKNAEVLVVVFTCNHCPTAQAYEDRLIKLTSDYAKKNVVVVAIMPNDPTCLRLDELDFSDIGDSYEEMKIRATEKKFNFPYLYDGDKEIVSSAYGPVATPHVFVFDKKRKLCYEGRVDDMESPFKTPKSTDARNAIDAVLNNQVVPVKTTKVFGCSVKWSEKKDLVEQVRNAWAKEPVNLEIIRLDSLVNLIKNPSDKLRLIHYWTPRSAACVKEFKEFVTINRMYRDRDFEFISICIDSSDDKDITLRFLKSEQASNSNYLLKIHDKNELIRQTGQTWKGVLPYTLLVEPGGKIVYANEGVIDPAKLKWIIVNNHLIGRYP
ncbi:MAG TPA: redoxin domain-containing protein [Puia sp.]|nr:redoxin domain-containing protein [Puia sp.]